MKDNADDMRNDNVIPDDVYECYTLMEFFLEHLFAESPDHSVVQNPMAIIPFVIRHEKFDLPGAQYIWVKELKRLKLLAEKMN